MMTAEEKWQRRMTLISYIKGFLIDIWEDTIVVETGGMGFNIHVPVSVIAVLPSTGEEVQIYTSLQVREDAMTLYGFLSRRDLQTFRQLLGVNGVGPKAALGILSTLTTEDLQMAIVSGDAKAISRAPGIGPKTAQRVILDLKDKVKMEDILPGGTRGGSSLYAVGAGASGADKEAIEALVALGYSALEAGKAVRKVPVVDGMTAEDILKESLRYLAF